jgi:glycosyltransferase involved in cell wall biosynthesis
MISVIIPTLNEAKLLPRLLRQFTSELRATYDLEIIVSDGGSSDDTLEIARAQGCVIVPHSGDEIQTIGGGRNAGADVARGDILVFLNADVLVSAMNVLFSETVKALRAPGVVAATCSVHIPPEEETISDRMFHYVHNGYVRFLNFIGEGMGRGECQIVLRENFRAVGGNNPALAAGEDYDLYRRLRRRGAIRMLRQVTIYESPRRFRKFGYPAIIWDWTKNALTVLVRNKSASKVWEAVR